MRSRTRTQAAPMAIDSPPRSIERAARPGRLGGHQPLAMLRPHRRGTGARGDRAGEPAPDEASGRDPTRPPTDSPLAPRKPPLPARAKHVIYLHMAGSPSQLDLFDDKPALRQVQRQAVPAGAAQGQAVRLHQRRAQHAGLAVQVRQARPGRHRAQRALDPPARRGRRLRRGQVDADRPVQPRPRPALLCTRAPPSSAARRWGRGPPTGWAPRTRTCPASSS